MAGRKRCRKGEILREGYHRKGYVRENGVEVRAYARNDENGCSKSARATDVPPTCVEDRGKKGKSEKRIEWRDDIVLSQFGYSVHQKSTERRAALDRAIAKWGRNPVMQNLNSKRNINPKESRVHRIMSSDVEWMKKSRNQRGGGEETVQYHGSRLDLTLTRSPTGELLITVEKDGLPFGFYSLTTRYGVAHIYDWFLPSSDRDLLGEAVWSLEKALQDQGLTELEYLPLRHQPDLSLVKTLAAMDYCLIPAPGGMSVWAKCNED